MSTRCQIELYDGDSLGVRLYHHSDGYPEFMGPKLDCFLKAAYEALKKAGYPYWWDSERVSSVIVKLSCDNYYEPVEPNTGKRDKLLYNGVPYFQPSMELHGDIQYFWKVFLSEKQGQYKIECYKIAIDWKTDNVKEMKKVNWKKAVREQDSKSNKEV